MSNESIVSFDAFREQWIEDVQAGNPSSVELGRRFANKLFMQWRDINDPSDDLVYCDGAGDGGIDIAYLDRSDSDSDTEGDIDPSGSLGDTWYLIQSKYGRAFTGSNTIFEEGRKVIETLDNQRPRLSSLAEGLLERLTLFQRKATEHNRIVLVFATEVPLTDQQRRALDDVRTMGRGRLGPIFDVESVSIETIYLHTLDDMAAGNVAQLRVPIQADLVDSGHGLLVGSISLMNLYTFLKAYRAETEDLDQLYEKNVRRFLGGRGRVNKAMQQTLRNAPEQFGLYNNGITLVVKGFDRTGGNCFDLVEPYVVNGCQTTKTIWEVFHQRLETGGQGTDPELDAWQAKATMGVVVTKIVKVGATGDDLLKAITRYTNSQNAVREKDFLTLESDFHQWAQNMGAQHGVFLEVQRGGWDSRRALQKQDPNLRQFTEAANAFDLLKVYGAGWLREAGTAFGSNSAFAPNGRLFKKIMQPSEEPFDVDDLYAAYRLEQAANGFEFGRRSPKTSRRQTRFLFYMIVLDLLRDVTIRANIATTPKSLTEALIRLFEKGNGAAADALLRTALDVVDEYLTQGTEDSLFAEPAFQNTFNSDLNGFLKWEKLGKGEDVTPNLVSLLSVTRRTMGRGQPSPRDLITAVIK